MPYASVADLPAHIKRYTPRVQRQWMHVFNAVFKKTTDETRAMKAANSILKKRLSNTEKTEHQDRMLMQVDTYLGNLQG